VTTTVAERSLGKGAVVPFEAHRLARPRVVLLVRDLVDLSDAEIVERFAWAVAMPRDPAGTFTAGSRTLFAERYGGEGIGFHGGGVRVGSEGEFQIKGIGQNPLAGEGSLLDYSHGGMSLFEGIQEAIWGEVFHRALPFGAVRSPAVLATGSPCWWVTDRWGADALRERYGDDVYLPRGLMVRQVAIRPAHFERAMLHRPPAALAATLSPDVERVRAAIGALPDVLPLPPGAEDLPGAERLRLGAVEMARRFAEQGAAAKSKRLIHGNISPSNICLDGRWIDFGSVTALPGWGDVAGYGPFWDDSELYAKMFATLCFNIRKYSPVRDQPLPQQEALQAEYTRVHARLLEQRFLALTGVPFELLPGERFAAERTRLFRTLVGIAQSGHRDAFVGHPDDDSGFGTYRLGSVLMAAARWSGTPSLDARLGEVLGSAELRHRLVEAYAPVMRIAQEAAAGRGVSPAALRRLAVINAAKSARTIRHLYRAHMVQHAEQMVLAHRDLDDLRVHADAWLQEIADEASFIHEDCEGLVTTFWRRRADVVLYDARHDAFVVREGQGREQSWPAAALRGQAEMSSRVVADALDYWGPDIPEAMT
jgi:hypothetical protein